MSADNADFFIMKPTQTVKYYGYAFNTNNLKDYVYEVVHKDDTGTGTEIKKENWKSIQENLIVRDSQGVNVMSSDIDWTNKVLFVFKAERSSGDTVLTDKQIVLVDNDPFLPSGVKEEKKEKEEKVKKPTFVVYKHDHDRYAVKLMLPSDFNIGNIAGIQFAFSNSLDSDTQISTENTFMLPNDTVNNGGAAIRIKNNKQIKSGDIILYIHTKDTKDTKDKLVINRNPFKTRIWMKEPKKSWEEDIKIIHRNT